jgi:hypothetical protein
MHATRRKQRRFFAVETIRSWSDYILPVNPYRLNQRLAIQQGIFVCPGDIRVTFAENLAAMPSTKHRRETVFKVSVVLSRAARREVIQRLFRMNVTPTTLFPGLDGFSRSLKLMMVFGNTLVPDIDWPLEGPRWPAKTQASTRPAK